MHRNTTFLQVGDIVAQSPGGHPKSPTCGRDKIPHLPIYKLCIADLGIGIRSSLTKKTNIHI